jgi:hypothetical protein
MLYAHIEHETKCAVDILSEEQYQLFLQFDLNKNIVTDDVFLHLSDDWEDVGRAIRKYKLNETGDALIFCDELEQYYNRLAVSAVMDTYRLERDMLLKSTDWTQMIDVNSDDGWKEYRQYLRDFPESFTPDLNDKGEQKIPFILPKSLDEYHKMIDR